VHVPDDGTKSVQIVSTFDHAMVFVGCQQDILPKARVRAGRGHPVVRGIDGGQGEILVVGADDREQWCALGRRIADGIEVTEEGLGRRVQADIGDGVQVVPAARQPVAGVVVQAVVQPQDPG